MSHLEKVTSWKMLNHAHNVTHDICLSIWFSKEFLLILAFCFLRETKNRKNSVDVYVIVTQQWHLYSEVYVWFCGVSLLLLLLLLSHQVNHILESISGMLCCCCCCYVLHTCIYHVNCEWNLIYWAINRNSGLSM